MGPGLYSMEESHVEKKWLGIKTEQEKENKDDANKKERKSEGEEESQAILESKFSSFIFFRLGIFQYVYWPS